ncbi:hypothetical protein ARMSODRAFT_1006462 [Armillaria solidipes]|uniref:Uncharacterized protein n=1 Tax=Armillaria solidipes TaxID=1076256 RepID=A0A2H3BNY7_9AGAR|nr:hypothetical protein ARMSODRAFT_1006462 [Armillaria solidipes]
MTSHSNKWTMQYVYQIALVIWSRPLAKFFLLGVIGHWVSKTGSTVVVLLVFVLNLASLHCFHESQQQVVKKAAKLEKIAPKFIDFTTDMEDRRVLYEADARSKVDAIRLCSSTVILHCLEYKQNTEAQYTVALQASTPWDKLDAMKNKLWLQKMQIDSLTSFYSQYKRSYLDNASGIQLEETPEEWVTRMNKMFTSRS